MAWKAKLVSQRNDIYKEHAGDLREDELGVDDCGMLWQCIVMSDIRKWERDTRFGAISLAYPHTYCESGEGPRVRLITKYTIAVTEE